MKLHTRENSPPCSSILVIEDEILLQQTIRDVLELSGYQVAVASDGKDGVEQALNRTPDLIICDIMMPQMNGYEVVRTLRQHPQLDIVPFIFLSARHTAQDQRRGMNLMADDYLVKPFHNRELLSTVKSRLEKAHRYKTRIHAAQREIAAHRDKIKAYRFITSHRIRGPLANIMGLIDIIQEDDLLQDHPLLDLLCTAATRLDAEIHMANELLTKEEILQERKGLNTSQTEE